MKKWCRAMLVLAAGISLLTVACGGDGPSAPDPISVAPAPTQSGGSAAAPAPAPTPAAPTGSSYVATSGVCNGKVVYTTADGFMGYCVLDGNVQTEGCMNVDPEKTDRLFIKIGIVSKGPGYTRTGYFHEENNQCGPTVANPGADPDNDKKAFVDGDVLELWRPVPPDACGHDQWDGDIRDGDPNHRLDVLGFMIVYPSSCRTCETANLQVTKTQVTEGDNYKVTINATWTKNGGDKASLYEGTTLIQTIIGPGAFNTLTVARDGKTHTYRVVLENGNLKPRGICEQSVTVETGKPCVVEWIEQEPEITYGEWGECKPPAEASQSTVKPECSQSRSVRTVIKEKNSCTGEVRVKSDKTTTESRPCECKKDSCDNYNPPVFGGALALTSQTPTQVTVTSGSVTPPGGTFSPTLPSVQPRPPAGSGDATFDTDYSVSYGPAELECKAKREYSIKIPQQEDEGECELSLTKDVDKDEAKDGDTLKYTLVVSNPGSKKCTGGGVLVEDQTPPNVDYSGSSGTVGQCTWQGPIKWNCGTLNPGASVTLWWTGKVDNPHGNCNDFVVDNTAKGWSDQTNWITSNKVSTSVDITCGPTCPPSSTTMSVNWSKLLKGTFGENPKCGDFGLTSLYKKEFGPGVENWSTDRAASIVIVKSGKCTADGPEFYAKKASPTDSSKWIGSGLGVSFSCDGKGKDLSHVEMCGCPVAGASSQGFGFDPYLVSDPVFE